MRCCNMIFPLTLAGSFVAKRLVEFIQHLKDDYNATDIEDPRQVEELADLRLKRRFQQSYNYDVLHDTAMSNFQLQDEFEDFSLPFQQWIETKPTPTDKGMEIPDNCTIEQVDIDTNSVHFSLSAGEICVPENGLHQRKPSGIHGFELV